MNTDDALIRMQRNEFRSINGKILRYLNILKITERRLQGIISLLDEYDIDSIKLSLAYLEKSGYIIIKDTRGADSIDCLDKHDRYRVQLDLTALGTELLMGIKDNPAVEV